MAQNQFQMGFFKCGAFLAVVFVCFSNTQAQTWKQIGNLPLNSDLRCAYFGDINHGVVGGVGCIYTYNFGVWKQATYPEPPGTIKSLRLLDPTHLYAASGKTDAWVSVDHGANWALTGSGLANADDVYLDANGILQGMNLTGTGMMKGTSFARINAKTCAAARDDAANMVSSPDGGMTWYTSKTNIEGNCGYCCIADSCSGTFYTLSDGVKSVLYKSTDGGVTWQFDYDFNETGIDVLDGGNSGVLYVQGNSNVFRSVVGGTFGSINGPGSSGDDRRMFSFGLNDRYLIDMKYDTVWLWDGSGNFPIQTLTPSLKINPVGCDLSTITLSLLWSSPDVNFVHIHAFTKDGVTISPQDTTVLSSPNNLQIQYRVQVPKGQESVTFYFIDSTKEGSDCSPIIIRDTSSFSFNLLSEHIHVAMPTALNIGYCQGIKVPITITADPCDTAWVDSIQLQPASGHFSLNSQLPTMILPGQTDTFWVIGSGFRKGQYSLQVRALGTSFSMTGSYDTTLSLHVTVSGKDQPSTVSFSNQVKIPSCMPVRFPISIEAYSCDTIWIDSLTMTFGDTSGTYLIDPYPPVVVLPGSSDTLWITTVQTLPGLHFVVLHFYGRSWLTASSIDTTFVLSYTVIPDPKSPRVIAHNLSLSNCKTSVVPIVLQALPCDSVEFTSCTLSLTGAANYSTNATFPEYLPPLGLDTILITFPSQNLSGVYVVSARVKGRYVGSQLSLDTTVQIRVTFTNASSSLVSDENSFNFSSIGICGDTATAVTFTNSGCDTITVTSDETVWQPGWSATDPQFPLTLPPDSSFTVQIHFKPTALSYVTQSVTYGFVGLGSVTGTAQLAFSGSAVPAVASFTMSDTTFDFGTFGHCTLAEGRYRCNDHEHGLRFASAFGSLGRCRFGVHPSRRE